MVLATPGSSVTGSVQLPEGVERAMPGDHITMKVKLTSGIAMEEGLRFAVREGGRTVGAGIITNIMRTIKSLISFHHPLHLPHRLRRVFGFENTRTGDNYLRAGPGDFPDVVQLDPPIHFHFDVR